ncbi:hypothetical protein DPMN_020335 [Dreissena polymorpha]|uniref:Uncharacterized protein n=1 Tax=Dreissena polymorpha TaxID=45954 RepID=A0A9D4SAY8_DREPO|nr:hypothetical protein DPMN_020335 [Dreissena polymorpha]
MSLISGHRTTKQKLVKPWITSVKEAGKLTSNNGGTSVRVRGPEGGCWHNKPTPYKYPAQSTMKISNQASVHLSGYKVNDSSES